MLRVKCRRNSKHSNDDDPIHQPWPRASSRLDHTRIRGCVLALRWTDLLVQTHHEACHPFVVVVVFCDSRRFSVSFFQSALTNTHTQRVLSAQDAPFRVRLYWSGSPSPVGRLEKSKLQLGPAVYPRLFFSLFPFECDAFFLPIGLWGHVGVSSMEVVVDALSSYSLDVQRNIAEAITDTFSNMCLWFAFKWEKSGLYSTRLEPVVEEWGRNRKFTQIERIK